MAHRAISLLRSNYGALGLKRTSTRGAISLGSASLASFPTPQGGSRIPELGPYGSVRGARGNSRPYRESSARRVKPTRMTHRQTTGGADWCYPRQHRNRGGDIFTRGRANANSIKYAA